MNDPENEELKQLIRQRIRDAGPIPFAEFMRLALYHPQHGYYHSPREKIGAVGDFYTSPSLHAIFGRLMGRQIEEVWNILDRPSPFVIVEFGPGKGLLAKDVLEYARDHSPPLLQAAEYLLAETSPAWQEEQRSYLAPFLAAGKVRWTGPSLGGESLVSFIFSNELLDAFPVHRIVQQGDQLREVYVRAEDGNFSELLGPPSTDALGEYLRAYGTPLDEGQRAEVNLQALDWLATAGRRIERGIVLTIDYGDEAEKLYHPARREGTLLCYFRHTASANPYERIGFQDITAHVNFTALMRRGEELGLKTIGYTEQYKFLASLGLLQDLEELEKDAERLRAPDFWKTKLALKSFLTPTGLGAFKVLAQAKGLNEPRLRGFKDPFGT